MKKDKVRLDSILWFFATLIEWINIVLFMASMGYEINIPIYTKLREMQGIVTTYYIAATIDIVLFGALAIVHRKGENARNTLLATYCCLIQIALLAYKIKL